MLVPAIQYGDWKTVKTRMRAAIAQLERGAGLVEVMTRDGMLDTDSQDGLLVMSGIVGGDAPNFHSFVPWALAWEPLVKRRTDPTQPTPLEDQIFATSLTSPWGVLGLLSPDSQPWLYPETRHQAFLEAALATWDELAAVGPRYYWSLQGKPLWSGPTGLHHVLAKLGIANDVLRAPLPPGGPRALLRHGTPSN